MKLCFDYFFVYTLTEVLGTDVCICMPMLTYPTFNYILEHRYVLTHLNCCTLIFKKEIYLFQMSWFPVKVRM